MPNKRTGPDYLDKLWRENAKPAKPGKPSKPSKRKPLSPKDIETLEKMHRKWVESSKKQNKK